MANSFSQNIEKIDETGNVVHITKQTSQNHIKGEVIIKLKEGTVEKEYLKKAIISQKLSVNDIKKQNYKISSDKKSFFQDYGNHKIRRLVSKYYPSKLKSNSDYGIYRLMVLEVSKNKDINEVISLLNSYTEIEFAEPNVIETPDDNPPNDPYYFEQWGFESTHHYWPDTDIDANRAWDFTTGNYGIKVAVVDMGIDYDNIDLGNGSFGNDGDKVRGGWDYKNNDSDPDDDDGHGTACAGIIGALRHNNELVAGLGGGNNSESIGVQLFALKVGNSGGGFTRSLAIDAVIEASMNTSSFGYGCHVINYSGGSLDDYSESWRHALHVAADNNVVFVAGKGNDNSSNWYYPSDYDGSWVISVGATTASDEHASLFSNTGNGIDVSAPGSGNVYTTQRVEDGSVGSFSGTSASAPHVAGLASLILSEAIEQGINLHHEDVEGIIEASAEDVNNATLPGYDDELGHGRINAGRALEYMNEPWEINHFTATGGSKVLSKDWHNIIIYGDGEIPNGTYQAKRYEVLKTVPLPDHLSGNIFVWGRGSNVSTGWSAANPNYQMGYCDVVSIGEHSVTLKTFIYDLKTLTGTSLGIKPADENDVIFGYTVLGVLCNFDRTISQTIAPGTENSVKIYPANNSINANNLIKSGVSVEYKADNIVNLNNGFTLEKGAEFSIIMDGCD